MSARASRLRLEEALRRVIDQEEALNRDVNGLLQVSLPDQSPFSLLRNLIASTSLAPFSHCTRSIAARRRTRAEVQLFRYLCWTVQTRARCFFAPVSAVIPIH